MRIEPIKPILKLDNNQKPKVNHTKPDKTPKKTMGYSETPKTLDFHLIDIII